MSDKKRVRMLLRVSSNQQLEADGDLSIQRDIVMEYIKKHDDWILDSKEYFEGSKSGYKKAVKKRDILLDALMDAQRKEYDILVVYKDDRVGRRMWEIGAYIMQLKSFNVDIYTVKDGCISPAMDDAMGQMILALRYANAQKSSSDTAQRVKDTAIELVKRGKYAGGSVPYGYRLVESGEISKKGRILHKFEIDEEKAEIVKTIYDYAYFQMLGPYQIARLLNADTQLKTKAPSGDFWRSETVARILKNPVYYGTVVYNRRTSIGDGRTRVVNNSEWVYSDEINEDLKIIDRRIWNGIQERREVRAKQQKEAMKLHETALKKNTGTLPLIDVIHCGYCKHKLTNGTNYSYWTAKDGEKRCKRKRRYQCKHNALHPDKVSSYDAEDIEDEVFSAVCDYLEQLTKRMKQGILDEIVKNNISERVELERQIATINKKIEKIEKDIGIMKDHIPEAMAGTYPLSIEVIAETIDRFNNNLDDQKNILTEYLSEQKKLSIEEKDFNQFYEAIPPWIDTLKNNDLKTQRVVVDTLIDKIFITEEDIAIKFKATIDQDGDSENFNYDSEVEFNSTSESSQLPRIIMTHGSSCNGTKLPLISGSLRTDIRTGLLHNIMMPSMLHPCFLFYLHLTESLISCSSNLLAAHSIEFLQEFLGIHFNEFTDIWDRFFICSAILRNNLLDHTKS